MTEVMLYTGICLSICLAVGYFPSSKITTKNQKITEDCLLLAVALVMTDLLILKKFNEALDPTYRICQTLSNISLQCISCLLTFDIIVKKIPLCRF